MEALREVDCRVMKGLGPEWTDKTITVFLDDIEPGTSDYVIRDMVRKEAASILMKAGFTRFIIKDIHNC